MCPRLPTAHSRAPPVPPASHSPLVPASALALLLFYSRLCPLPAATAPSPPLISHRHALDSRLHSLSHPMLESHPGCRRLPSLSSLSRSPPTRSATRSRADCRCPPSLSPPVLFACHAHHLRRSPPMLTTCAPDLDDTALPRCVPDQPVSPASPHPRHSGVRPRRIWEAEEEEEAA